VRSTHRANRSTKKPNQRINPYPVRPRDARRLRSEEYDAATTNEDRRHHSPVARAVPRVVRNAQTTQAVRHNHNNSPANSVAVEPKGSRSQVKRQTLLVLLGIPVICGCALYPHSRYASVGMLAAPPELTVATAQRFHACLGNAIWGGDMPVLCWVGGLPNLGHTGLNRIHSHYGDPSLPRLSWKFVEPPQTPERRRLNLHRHLLTLALTPLPSSCPRSPSPTGDDVRGLCDLCQTAIVKGGCRDRPCHSGGRWGAGTDPVIIVSPVLHGNLV